MEAVPKYKIVYADPPWRFEVWDQISGQDKSPENYYDTMTAEELLATPVKDLVDDDAILAAWVYDPCLPLALEMGRAWGFEFVTVLFRWLKTTDVPGQLRMFPIEERLNFGLGYHTRGGGCEECWLFKRGKGLPVLRHDIRKEFFSPLREHSRKPDETRGWITDLYGDHPRVEFFARTRTPKWDIMFSNQADKFK